MRRQQLKDRDAARRRVFSDAPLAVRNRPAVNAHGMPSRAPQLFRGRAKPCNRRRRICRAAFQRRDYAALCLSKEKLNIQNRK